MIAEFKKPSHTRWAGATLLLAALACIVLTNAYVAKADFTFGTPTRLGPTINDSNYENSPSISADGLSFYFYQESNMGNIWVATRETTSDPWGEPVNLGSVLGSFDGGGGQISTDGLSLYYHAGWSGMPKTYGGSDLWVTTRTTTDGQWSEPVNLGPVVNSSAHDFDPSISTDGLLVFFMSDRPGGFGGHDIWVTTRTTKSDPWQEPVNLGQAVNGPQDDGWPYISADGLLLFFASERSGRRQIYVATRETTSDEWGAGVNIGPPVNTPEQSCWPTLSADGSTLYFVSNRAGSSGLADIWQVQLLPNVDLNGDGKVDFKDFRKLAQYWGQNEPSCDIAPLPNGDGIVDEKDLNLLAEHLVEELQPIARWELDESEGDTAYDSAGDKDGTLYGNPAWAPTDGMVVGALQFDGLDDYVSTPFVFNPGKGSFSIFAWIKGGAPGQVIISQMDITDGRATKHGSAWLWADPLDAKLITSLMDPPFAPLTSEYAVADGQWHHVGLVYDFEGLHRYLYLDGVEVAKDTDPMGGIRSSNGLHFGAGTALEAGSFFSGLIDDIRIYDEVLSAEEVAELAR